MSTASPLDIVESEFPPGLSLIEASAGTGKTYAISHLAPRLLLDGTIGSLGEILLVTFTNDAARELSDRVRRVLEMLASPVLPEKQAKDEGIRQLRGHFSGENHRKIIGQALVDIDRLNVSTIHSFCQRTLQAEGTLCGIPVQPEVITNADAYLEEAMSDFWQQRVCTDSLLASLANSGRWSLQQDLQFVRKAFPLEDFTPVPDARPFEETLERIRHAPRLLTSEIRKELADLIETVRSWNGTGGDDHSRGNHLKALDDAQVFIDRGFFSALEWVADLDRHITAKSNAGKSCRATALQLRAVILAKETVGLVNQLRWHWQNACLRTIREKVPLAVQASRQITQDGLILTLRDALRSANREALADRLRQRYKVALIDESQDTDPRQFEIFANIFIGFQGEASLPNHRLVMIGDPKQAIYGFRGADVNTYLLAKSRARKVFTLDTTYRAPQPLVEAINSFFDRPGSLLKDGLEFHPAKSGKTEDIQLFLDGQPSGGRVEAWIVPDTDEDYRTSVERTDLIVTTVATEIVRLLENGTLGNDPENAARIEPGHIAVLTSSNSEAQIVATALKERGVPAIVPSGADVMATEEAAELLCLLRAVNEPRRAGLRYRALATRLVGYDLAAVHRVQSDAGKDDEALRRFQQWQVAWERKGIAAAIALMDAHEGISARLALLDFGERRLTNFRQLIDLLQAASQDHSSRPEHLLRWLAQEIARAASRDATEERQIQLESDRDAVQVVTMHKAKGLEYELVFSPFLWWSREPGGIQVLARTQDEPRDRLVEGDLAKDSATQLGLRRSALEDRLRLAYVSMTRAKVHLWIYGGEITNARKPIPASPLDWLLRDALVDGKSPEQFRAWTENAKTPGRGSRHAAGIEALCSGKKAGLILQKEPPPVSNSRWQPATPVEAMSLAALPAAGVGSGWSVTSFSSLTRETNPHGIKESEAGRASRNRIEPARSSGAAGLNAFGGAAGGALIGTAIHEWLQQWDFDEPDPKAIKEHLRKYHLPQARDRSAASVDESVFLMLKELRLAMLPGLGCSVAEACPSHETSEWHFHLPIKSSLHSQKLAEAFARHASKEHQSYASMLAMLPSQDLQGFLQGFMDRLAFHGDAWGVVDWKTNRLGEQPTDYRHESMLVYAMEHHYLLQAHLYLVALRRYLRKAAPEVRLAGAWLVFLRGIRAGDASGILHIHPEDPLLGALDELFFEGE